MREQRTGCAEQFLRRKHTPPGEQWGEGTKSWFSAKTYDAQVLQAAHDLYDGKMPITRINAARRLGELRATSNLAIERLEKGMKDDFVEVRLASAAALEAIGTDRAMRHLREAQEKGLVPCDLPSSTTGGASGSAFQGSTETKVEVRR